MEWHEGSGQQPVGGSGSVHRRGYAGRRLCAQQHPELHCYGRDARGAGRGECRAEHHPYGGRPAGHCRRRGRPAPRRRARSKPRRSATPWRSATTRCARASPALYSEWYGVAVAPERIAVTAGSSAAFVLAFLAMFDAGDAVALPSPGYPCYRHILTALGQRSVLLETGPACEWMPTRRRCCACGAPRRHQGAADCQPRQSRPAR